MPVNKPAGGFVWVGEVNSLPGEHSRQLWNKKRGSLRFPTCEGRKMSPCFDKPTAETHPCYRSSLPAPSQEGIFKPFVQSLLELTAMPWRGAR